VWILTYEVWKSGKNAEIRPTVAEMQDLFSRGFLLAHRVQRVNKNVPADTRRLVLVTGVVDKSVFIRGLTALFRCKFMFAVRAARLYRVVCLQEIFDGGGIEN